MTTAAPAAADAWLPRPFRIADTRRETHDTVTLELESLDRRGLPFAPGQFTMVGPLGVGDVPISISGHPGRPQHLVHTIRDVGGVTRTLCQASEGDVLAVRGPFGVGWRVSDGTGGDIVIVAGGVGLAPLQVRRYRGRRVAAGVRTRECPLRRQDRERRAVRRRPGRLGVGRRRARSASRSTGHPRRGPVGWGWSPSWSPGRRSTRPGRWRWCAALR